MTILEAARALDRKWDFVASRKVEFRAVKCGRVYFIPPEAVEEFKANHAVTEPKPAAALPFPKATPRSRRERVNRQRELARTARAAGGRR